mgnify:CR=1 FL=1
MSTISPKKLEKLLDEVPGLDSETRKKIEEANKPSQSKRWGWGHGAPAPKTIKVNPL